MKKLSTIILVVCLTGCSAKVLRLNSGSPAQYKIDCKNSTDRNACREKADEICRNGFKTDDTEIRTGVLGHETITVMKITCKN